jgi:hypothetical protein
MALVALEETAFLVKDGCQVLYENFDSSLDFTCEV